MFYISISGSRGCFLLFLLIFSTAMKKLPQPMRICFTLKISWKSSCSWLLLAFHFGSEDREEQFKNHPVCWIVEVKRFRKKGISSVLFWDPFPNKTYAHKKSRQVNQIHSSLNWHVKKVIKNKCQIWSLSDLAFDSPLPKHKWDEGQENLFPILSFPMHWSLIRLM